jgi:hypothetical protein
MSDYCTLAEIKSRLWPENTTPDSVNDTDLTSVITAVSREIDIYCATRFHTSVADETRYFLAEEDDRLWVGNLVSVTTLQIDQNGDGIMDGTLVANTDYLLAPYNAALDSVPYNWIEIASGSSYGFPVGIRRGVKVIGKFGWSSCPAAIKEACILQAMRAWKRKDSIFGVVGPSGFYQISVMAGWDPDAARAMRLYTMGLT